MQLLLYCLECRVCVLGTPLVALVIPLPTYSRSTPVLGGGNGLIIRLILSMSPLVLCLYSEDGVNMGLHSSSELTPSKVLCPSTPNHRSSGLRLIRDDFT